MVKALKNLSKTTKVVAVSSIAGAAVIGVGVGVGIGVSGLNKGSSKSSSAYDELSKTLLPSNSPYYKSWEAAGRSMITALKKGTTRAILDAPDYFLVAMSKRPVFKDADSEIKYQFYEQETKQTIVFIADLDVEDEAGNKKPNIIRCMINGQEVTSTEILNTNAILDHETTVNQDREARRQKNIQRLQEIAVDENKEFYPTITPSFSKASSWKIADAFKNFKLGIGKNPLSEPDDADGFTFRIKDIVNSLSSGAFDVLLEIKLKTDEGQPLSRTMVRHMQTVSDAESIDGDPFQYLDNYVDAVKPIDVDFLTEFWDKYNDYKEHKVLPSKIPFEDVKKYALFYTPSTKFIVGDIEKIISTNDDDGTMKLSVRYSFADKRYSDYERSIEIVVDGFHALKHDPSAETAKILRQIKEEEEELDQVNILKYQLPNVSYDENDDLVQFLQEQSDRDLQGEDAITFFNYFPADVSPEIDKAHRKPLTNEALVKFGFPPSVTLNDNAFKYEYWMDEITSSTDVIDFHIMFTPYGSFSSLGTEIDYKILVDTAGMAKLKQYNLDQENMAKTQRIGNQLLHSGQYKFAIDSSMDLSKLLPYDPQDQSKTKFEINDSEIILNDDAKQWAFLGDFHAKFLEKLAAEGIDPTQFQYRLLFQNFISTDGTYKVKFVADFKGNKYVAQPTGDQWKDAHPEPIEIKFEGLDKVLIDRSQEFLKNVIQDIIDKKDPTNNPPTRYFSYEEINSAAFKDPSSVYFGYTFNPNSIIVPGIKDAELTQAVIVAFNTRVSTLADPAVSYTYSHGQIIRDGQTKYVISITRGNETREVEVPVQVMRFTETKTNVKQYQLEQFDKEVIKPNNMVFQIEAYDYVLPQDWFHISKSFASFGGDTDDRITFKTTDPNTRRLFAWLKLFSVVTDGDEGMDDSQRLEVKIDPNKNADGTYNVHLRIVGWDIRSQKTINWYDRGLNGEIVIKANILDREANGLQNKIDELKDLQMSIVSPIDVKSFDHIIRNHDDYLQLIRSGLKLYDPTNNGVDAGAETSFDFENYYYEVKFDGTATPTTQGTSANVKVSAFLKSDPTKSLSADHAVKVFSDSFQGTHGEDRMTFMGEVKQLISSGQWELNLTDKATINMILNNKHDIMTQIASSTFETAFSNQFGIQGYDLYRYHVLKVIETPNGNQYYYNVFYQPSRMNPNRDNLPTFVFEVPVTLNENPNALKTYVSDTLRFYDRNLVDGATVVSSVPIDIDMIDGDLALLNKYLPKQVKRLDDGYIFAQRVLVDHRYKLVVQIFKDDSMTEKVFGFTVDDQITLVGASPLGIPMADDSSTIYN